jgi:hypothetical protein
VLKEVARAKVVVLFLTPDCLLRPWVLLECYWACLHHVTIVPIQVKGTAYDHATARHTLAHLAASLDEGNAGATHAITEALAPHGHTLEELCQTLHDSLPHLIALPYNPHDSANHMAALIQDMVERVVAKMEKDAARQAESSAVAKKPGHVRV